VTGREDVELRVLGPVDLLGPDGAPLPLPEKVRRLLAALASSTDAVVSTDRLVEAVWGADLPRHGDAALQTLESRLRAVLRSAGSGGLAVHTRAQGYALAADADSLDLLRFEGLLGQARTAADEPSVIQSLAQALELWRGPAFGEYAREPFAETEAVRLDELRVRAAEDLAELHLRAGRPHDALVGAAALTQAHPLRERPHAILIRAQHDSGRTAEALATYEQLRHRLADELGLDPSPSLAALQAEILGAGTPLSPPTPGTPADPGVRPVSPHLFGRDKERRRLADLVASSRMITVTGPGGVGKTALAAAVVADAYPRPSAVVELAGLPPEALVAMAVTTALRVPVSHADDPLAALATQLRSQQTLLVLDNCELLAADAGRLTSELLRTCPGITVVITSRTVLGLAEEVVLEVRPLEVPDPALTPPDELRRNAAVALFLTRTRHRLGTFEPDDGTVRQVARLCARLDGLPLAIELAAGRMSALTPAELLDHLPWRLTVLRGGPGTDPRHRTLHALVDWSFDTMGPADRELFELVSVFAGTFGLADATGVVARLAPEMTDADVAAGLGSLIDQSMLVRPADGGFVLLETMRLYGRERLSRADRLDAVNRAHAEHFAERAMHGYNEDLYGDVQMDQFARLEERLDELRSAVWWTLEHDPDLGADLVGGLGSWLEQRMVGEVVDWAERLLAVRDLAAIAAGPPSPRWSRVLSVAAAGARFFGKFDRAVELAVRAGAVAGDDPLAQMISRYLQGEVALFRGELDRVVQLNDEVAAIARPYEQLRPAAVTMELLAALARGYAGDDTATTTARELQDECERGGWTVVTAWAMYIRGELTRDADLLTDAMSRARELQEHYLLGVCLVSLAAVRSRAGDFRAADAALVEVIEHFAARGDWVHQWVALRTCVQHLERRGRTEEAVRLAVALLAPVRQARGWGEDAQALERLVAEAETTQPADRWRQLRDQALALTDTQVVECALAALATGSAVQPVEAEEGEVLDR